MIMSRKNNVNPDHYKIAGRDRPGEDIIRARMKDSLSGAANMNWIPKSGGKSSGKVRSGLTRPSRAAAENRASQGITAGPQTSTKTGVVSGAKKLQSSRNFFDPDAASSPVAGAFGKTGSLSEPEEEMVHPKEDVQSERRDFIAERRRQDRRAKK
jgi:hypothetical protein